MTIELKIAVPVNKKIPRIDLAGSFMKKYREQETYSSKEMTVCGISQELSFNEVKFVSLKFKNILMSFFYLLNFVLIIF